MSYDLRTTCRLARWSAQAPDHWEYGAAGLAPCAVVCREEGEPHGWRYRVRCAVAHKSFSSRDGAREECVRQAAYWLRHVDCPGAVGRPAEDEPPVRAHARRSALFRPMKEFVDALHTATTSYRQLTLASHERLQASRRVLSETHEMVVLEGPSRRRPGMTAHASQPGAERSS